MAHYLLIASSDPFESQSTVELQALASTLVKERDTVVVLFVQDGVFAARAGVGDRWWKVLADSGVELYADELSLRERGLRPEAIGAAVRVTSLDVVIDALADGHKVLWH